MRDGTRGADEHGMVANQDESGCQDNKVVEDDDDEYYADRFESVRTPTGLEIGLRVTWPLEDNNNPSSTTNSDGGGPASELSPPPKTVVRLNLSTCLPETALAPLFDGTQWAGTRVWPAAVVALQYLLSLPNHTHHNNNNNKTLLELGCGLGVPGMIWHAATLGSTVILTDKDELMPQLRANLVTNFSTSTHSSGAGHIAAHSLDWSVAGIHELLRNCAAAAGSDCGTTSSSTRSDGSTTDTNDGEQLSSFDIVLNCDCIFEPLYGDSWKQLLACQQELLRINPHTLMLTSVERRHADGIDQYLDAAARRQNSCSSIDRVERVHVPHAPRQVELYRLYGKTTTTTGGSDECYF